MINQDDDDTAEVNCDLFAGPDRVDRTEFHVLLDLGDLLITENFTLEAGLSNFGGGSIELRCTEVGNSDRVDLRNGVLNIHKVDSVL